MDIVHKKIYQVLNKCPEGIGRLTASLAKAKLDYAPLIRNNCSHFAPIDPKTKQRIPDYADLAACMAVAERPMAMQGITIVGYQGKDSEGVPTLITLMSHSSGQWIDSVIDIKAPAENPQKVIAYETYMRRLAYCTLAGLSAEDDDDGQEAVHAAVVASEKSSEKWTSMLLDKLKSCRDDAERALVVEQAERGVLEGKLKGTSLDAIKSEKTRIEQEELVKTVEKPPAKKKKPTREGAAV